MWGEGEEEGTRAATAEPSYVRDWAHPSVHDHRVSFMMNFWASRPDDLTCIELEASSDSVARFGTPLEAAYFAGLLVAASAVCEGDVKPVEAASQQVASAAAIEEATEEAVVTRSLCLKPYKLGAEARKLYYYDHSRANIAYTGMVGAGVDTREVEVELTEWEKHRRLSSEEKKADEGPGRTAHCAGKKRKKRDRDGVFQGEKHSQHCA